jgi:uncharacterized protein (UPF0332 family)
LADEIWLDKAARYLASATLLREAGDYDSAVSRAYYGARYAAIELLLARKTGWQPSWQHQTIAARIIEQARALPWLRNTFMTGQASFHSSWLRLLDSRSAADYSVRGVSDREAQRCILFAQRVLDAVQENMP